MLMVDNNKNNNNNGVSLFYEQIEQYRVEIPPFYVIEPFSKLHYLRIYLAQGK